jgi:hypothetical protein
MGRVYLINWWIINRKGVKNKFRYFFIKTAKKQLNESLLFKIILIPFYLLFIFFDY